MERSATDTCSGRLRVQTRQTSINRICSRSAQNSFESETVSPEDLEYMTNIGMKLMTADVKPNMWESDREDLL